MYNKWVSAGLFALAFSAIVFGGYQCATRVDSQREPFGQGYPPPIDEGDGAPYSYNNGEGSSSGEGSQTSLSSRNERRCEREEGRGARARFDFNSAGLRGFMMGRRLNNAPECARLYVDMNLAGEVGTPKTKRYGGTLYLSFRDGRQAYHADFDAGSHVEDAWHNYWRGTSWSPNNSGRVWKYFYAIFEGDNSAVILKLEDVRTAEAGDGKIIYIGAGKLFYKMFNIYTSDSDKCHRRGLHVTQANQTPDRGTRKCWQKDNGAWSCLPQGALPEGSKITIDLKNTPCYSQLGTFSHLNIETAFNVGDVEEL